MKSLCYFAISALMMAHTGQVYGQIGQGLKDKLGLGQKKGKQYAADITEEELAAILGGKIEDEGVVNDFQQTHLNQVVFYGEEKKAKEVTDADVKTKFGINDPIYYSFYLPQSVRNYIVYPMDDNGNWKTDYYYDHQYKKFRSESHSNHTEGLPEYNSYGSVLIKVYIDGKEVKSGTYCQDAGYNSKETSLSAWLCADPTDKEPSDAWRTLMEELTAGEHEVKVDIYGKKTNNVELKRTKETIATGTFTLVKKSGEKFSPKFGKTWANYNARMNDKELEAKILKEIQRYATASGWKEKFNAVKISSSDWGIIRNNLTGVVTGRTIHAYCKADWPGGICKVQSFVFKQDHNGTDFQTSLYCIGVAAGSYPTAIDCE